MVELRKNIFDMKMQCIHAIWNQITSSHVEKFELEKKIKKVKRDLTSRFKKEIKINGKTNERKQNRDQVKKNVV